MRTRNDRRAGKVRSGCTDEVANSGPGHTRRLMPVITEKTPVRFRDDLPTAVDVAIVGGGIAGVMTAWFLQRAGKRVLICEKGRIAGEQSCRNWGFVRQAGRHAAELPIMMECMDIWQALQDEIGDEVGFRRPGSLFISQYDKELTGYAAWVEKVAKPHGLPSRMIDANSQRARAWPQRYTMMSLLLGALLLCYIDRTIISLAVIEMQREFGWSDSQKGYVLSVFSARYLVTQLLGGLLSNRFGGRLHFPVRRPRRLSAQKPAELADRGPSVLESDRRTDHAADRRGRHLPIQQSRRFKRWSAATPLLRESEQSLLPQAQGVSCRFEEFCRSGQEASAQMGVRRGFRAMPQMSVERTAV